MTDENNYWEDVHQHVGYISSEKTVWCGNCAEWYQDSAKHFAKIIRIRGWKYTRKHGWLCPDCVIELIGK